MNKIKSRQSGIELLRIYAIMSVIILHYFNAGIGGGTKYLSGTESVFIGRGFLTLCFCAVDLFIMISGYFLSGSSNRSFSKIFFLFAEASVLRMFFYCINCVIGIAEFSFSALVSTAVSFGYFIVFYSITYLVSPIINLGFNQLDKQKSTKAVFILFFLFSVIPTIVYLLENFNVLENDWNSLSTVTKEGSFEGYNIVNFFLCYIIGGYIRHWHFEKKKLSKIFGIFVINSLILLIWGYLNWNTAYTYDNPLVITEGALLLLMFKDFEFKSKVINELASSGFTCYLVHGFFLKYANIEKYASGSWYVLLLHVISTVITIYLICYVIHKIYSLLFGWIERKLSPFINRLNISLN